MNISQFTGYSPTRPLLTGISPQPIFFYHHPAAAAAACAPHPAAAAAPTYNFFQSAPNTLFSPPPSPYFIFSRPNPHNPQIAAQIKGQGNKRAHSPTTKEINLSTETSPSSAKKARTQNVSLASPTLPLPLYSAAASAAPLAEFQNQIEGFEVIQRGSCEWVQTDEDDETSTIVLHGVLLTKIGSPAFIERVLISSPEKKHLSVYIKFVHNKILPEFGDLFNILNDNGFLEYPGDEDDFRHVEIKCYSSLILLNQILKRIDDVEKIDENTYHTLQNTYLFDRQEKEKYALIVKDNAVHICSFLNNLALNHVELKLIETAHENAKGKITLRFASEEKRFDFKKKQASLPFKEVQNDDFKLEIAVNLTRNPEALTQIFQALDNYVNLSATVRSQLAQLYSDKSYCISIINASELLEKARLDVDIMIEQNSDNETALWALAQFYLEHNDIRNAKLFLKEIVSGSPPQGSSSLIYAKASAALVRLALPSMFRNALASVKHIPQNQELVDSLYHQLKGGTLFPCEIVHNIQGNAELLLQRAQEAYAQNVAKLFETDD